MSVAIIPARGGSKRIPRKNVRPFAGRPMLAWPVAAARASGLFERIIVSTDDDEVAAVAEAAGAEVPFRRPADLADDHTPTVPVIAHAIRWLAEQGAAPDLVCCIYATAPFLRAEDLVRGREALAATHFDYAFSATDFGFPVQRGFTLGADGAVALLHPEHAGTRSQDLPRVLHDAGQFYWGRRLAWLGGVPVMGPSATVVEIPRWRVQDIDTPDDWTRAELLARVLER